MDVSRAHLRRMMQILWALEQVQQKTIVVLPSTHVRRATKEKDRKRERGEKKENKTRKTKTTKEDKEIEGEEEAKYKSRIGHEAIKNMFRITR